MVSNYGIKIKGVGYAAPEQIISNDDFKDFVETSDEWITTRTGIKRRHISDGTPIYKYGVIASQIALKDAGISIDDIDFVICSTVSSDFITPSMSTLVASELSARDIPCVDVNAACAGFVYAIDMAHKYLAIENYKNILVISAEALSRITNFDDRSTCVLFGDGAGAAVISKSDGIYSCILGSKTESIDKILAKSFKLSNPFTNEKANELDEKYPHVKNHGLYMDGKEVYKFATAIMPYAINESVNELNITPNDLDLIIPHQANIRIVQTAAKNLNISMEKIFVNIEEFGNTSSASIPICLAQAKQNGRIKHGDKINIVGFGAGLVYASCTFEY